MAGVEFQIQRLGTFFLPIQGCEQFRNLDGTRTWRHEEKCSEEERENWLDGKHATDIADSVVSQLFGFQNGTAIESSLLETCDGPEWSFTIDLDDSPYTQKSIEEACTVLVQMLNAQEDFFADPPYVHNRGSADYYDPVKRYGDFDVPEQVRSLLKPRRKPKR
jgi:hypothetical protein